ncbi:MAG: glycosyltransferase family 4 protein, partial [Desulfobacteraceae bacterium]
RAGSSRRTLEIIRGLKPRGYEIDLWVGQEASATLIKSLAREGIAVYRVPGLQKYLSPASDLVALQHLGRQFRKKSYDLVHTHLAKAGILGRLAAKWARVPLIAHTVHGPSFPGSKPGWQQRLYRGLERWAAGYTQALIFVGAELRDDFLKAGIGRQENSHLIYTGRNFSPFLQAAEQRKAKRRDLRPRLGFREDDLVVGYVARVVPSKGHIFAIQAAARLRAKFPQLRFLFVGQANLASEQQYQKLLWAEVVKRQLQDRIVFLGHQSDIENYYAIFDLFILPSLYEGLPNVILEAAVMGLPVVAFDCGGVREILGNWGCIVPRGDVAGFIVAIEEALNQIITNGRPVPDAARTASLLKTWSNESMIQAKDRLYQNLWASVKV